MMETTQSGARKRFVVIMTLFLVFRLLPSLLLGSDSGEKAAFPSLPPPVVYSDGGVGEGLPVAGVVIDWGVYVMGEWVCG